jgi:hypothetical protein
MKEVSKNVNENHDGPAAQFLRKVEGEAGPNWPILDAYIRGGTRGFMEPRDLDSQPSVIQEYEKCVWREARAFIEWKVRLMNRVADGKLPKPIEKQIESFTILDMFDDMRAHSLRKATSVQVAAFHVEFGKIPNASRKGVLRWYNHLAKQDGDSVYNDLDEVLSEVALRLEPRDEYVLGASLRVRDFCDQVYERLVGRIYKYAIRPKYLRPWHAKKTEEILDAELVHNAPRNMYYMDDEELKRIVLMVANHDRITHNITSVPAIFGEFQHMVQLKRGQMMLRDNDDLCAAANAAKVEFAGAYAHSSSVMGYARCFGGRYRRRCRRSGYRR